MDSIVFQKTQIPLTSLSKGDLFPLAPWWERVKVREELFSSSTGATKVA
jgi:hypothetical protein